MDLKKIKGRAVMSAFVALSCVALSAGGCGDEDKPDGDGKTDAGDGDPDGGGGGTYDASLTLVHILDVDATDPILISHKIVALDATGKPLDPPIEATSEKGTGKFTLKGLPNGTPVSIYAQGVGPVGEADSTYDTIVMNFNRLSGDKLLRISNAGTLASVPASAGFTVRDDRASAAGGIYWAPKGARRGTVGCAKVCIDGKTPPEDLAPRYVAANANLPTTPDKQSKTSRAGRFYVGNLTEGAHKIGASLDDCKTTLGNDVEFFVPFSRAEATSPVKAMLVQLFIDLDVAANPTPKDCPTE